MKYTTACAMILATVTVHLLRAEDNPKQVDSSAMCTDRNLYAFSQSAILRDRGLACSPFAGSTDRWIVEKLMTNEAFRKAIDTCSVPPWLKTPAAKGSVNGKGSCPRSTVLDVYQASDRFSEALASKLLPKQHRKLLGVYLRVEGTIALCRPEFAPMFNDLATQQQIVEYVQDTWVKNASVLHQAIFGLSSSNIVEAPIYQAELRRLSADVDWKIVQMLTETERLRLWDLIYSSRALDSVTTAPPSF